MTHERRATRVIRFVLIWALYGALVAAFLFFLNESGFWNNQSSTANGTANIMRAKNSSAKQEKRIPNLWERPTTVTFKITRDTKISIGYGGIRLDENGERLTGADGEPLDKQPLREEGTYLDIKPNTAVQVITYRYWSGVANQINFERYVGLHEGEQPRPEYNMGGPGWANNITFSGWVVSSNPTEVTVRYP